VIVFSNWLYPGDGICYGLFKAVVVRIEFPMGFATAINQAVATLHPLTGGLAG